MATDKDTNIQKLKDTLLKFRDARDWAQFHDPKNLAEAISIEAGELQEHFLWKTVADVERKYKEDSDYRTEIGEELADVIIYCLNFANAAGIDVTSTVLDKITKAANKYPVAKAKGKATKYTKL